MSLKLVLLSAAGLKDADLISKSDPYVVFRIDNQKQQSRTIRDRLNPVWNPPDVIIFNHIPNTLIQHRLHITVMDRDIIFDDKIGHGTIDFRQLPPMVETQMEVNLGLHGFFKKATLSLRVTYSRKTNAFDAGGGAPPAHPPAVPVAPPPSGGPAAVDPPKPTHDPPTPEGKPSYPVYDQSDQREWSPLILASADGRASAVRMLLDLDADINKTEKKGGTPLFVAASYGQTPVVRLLLERGCAEATNAALRAKAIAVAEQHKHEDVSKLLTEWKPQH